MVHGGLLILPKVQKEMHHVLSERGDPVLAAIGNGETISTRFMGRTSHNKIATDDEAYCKGAVERIILDFSKPGEETLRKSRSLEYNF